LGNNSEVGQILEQETATKFTNKVSGNAVLMLVNKQIGYDDKYPNDPFIDGPAFAEEVYWHKSQGREIKVKINSPGGRVVQGWDMVDAIIESGADTMNTGIAYSMGGICLIAGKHRTAYAHATAMIHAPHTKSGKVSPAAETIKNAFRILLESRTKFTKAEVDDMVDSGKDYFFTAKEMLKKGMIDEIIPSDVNVTPPTYASAKDLCAFFNSYEQNQNDQMENPFKDMWAKMTGKSTDAEQILAYQSMQKEVETLKASITSKEQEITSLNAKVTELETAGKADESTRKAKELIEGAKKANKFGKLKPEDEAKLIENAVANYDAAKIMIDAMPSKKEAAAASVPDLDAKGEQNSYEWMMKNDPEGLKALYESDPELFNKLADDYAKQPSKK
jgi:ATP-dependent protease ClpP protease subunit